MQLTANGRIQRSAAEWRAIIARYERSGAKHAEFCTREGIAPHSVKKHDWRRKVVESPAGACVEVPSAPEPASWAVKLEFPSGLHLRVRGERRVGSSQQTADSGVQRAGGAAESV
jgi:hypothetical protein